MGDCNIILQVLLVWTFTAICKAEDSLNIICEDVTGHVRDELTLTCRVSYKDTNCMKMYKFTNKDKDTEICRKEFTSDPCVQLTSFSCPYTANEVMTTTFKFFIQTKHITKSVDFTVTISEARKDEQLPHETVPTEDTYLKTGNTVLAVTGVFICLVVMIAVGLILRWKYKCSREAVI